MPAFNNCKTNMLLVQCCNAFKFNTFKKNQTAI